jgi:DNA-binding NarL/FixJ family response regulator
VLIVDDHPLLRDGLGKVLNQQVDFRVCGEAGDARGALAAIPKCRPDVVIVDLTMEDGNGLDLIKDIRAQHAALPVLVLSMHHENLYAERAIRAGAQGYVMKREPVGTVVDSLRKVLHGHIALSENMVSRMIVSPGAGPIPRTVPPPPCSATANSMCSACSAMASAPARSPPSSASPPAPSKPTAPPSSANSASPPPPNSSPAPPSSSSIKRMPSLPPGGFRYPAIRLATIPSAARAC